MFSGAVHVKFGKTDQRELIKYHPTQNSGHERIKRPEAQTLISNPYAFSDCECICVESLVERMDWAVAGLNLLGPHANAEINQKNEAKKISHNEFFLFSFYPLFVKKLIKK